MTLKKHYNELCSQLNTLDRLITSMPPQHAVVAQIAPTAKSQEHEPVKIIMPIVHYGSSAVELAAKSYKDLHTLVGISQKSSRRTPGALWFDTSKAAHASEIVTCIKAINQAKLSIKGYVTENFSTAAQRFDILKQSCPGVMTVHLYRLIRCYDQADLQSVRFTWLQQEVIHRPDKAALIAKINYALECSICETYSKKLSELLQHINQVPQSSLRTRRSVKPQPVANIKGTHGKTSPVTSAMPIIILQAKEPEIRIMRGFDVALASQRKTRSDKLETSELGTFQGVLIERVI